MTEQSRPILRLSATRQPAKPEQPRRASPTIRPPIGNLRAQVIRLLLGVQQGQSMSQLQAPALQQVNEADRALFHQLSLGVLRQWFVLKQMALPLLDGEAPNATIETALYLGLYQLLFTRIPDHAAISETVTATRQVDAAEFAGLVNAVLRRASREREDLLALQDEAHGLPSWLFKRLKKDWGDQALPLAQVLRQAAPLFLRINPRLISREDYLIVLEQAGITAQASPLSAQAIQLLQSVSITQLPGYDLGWFAVQDVHAQYAGTIMGKLDDLIVLDACAAPGGKTAHLLSHSRPRCLIALDHDASRLQRVQDNLQRLQLLDQPVQLVEADATRWQASTLYQDGQPVQFDRIVLDAPCTAIGVLRRHPDIRLLRQSGDVAQTVALQQAILDNLWPQLKPGGQLLYITCSILKAENEQQMQQFFDRHADAVPVALDLPAAIQQTYGQQLLPTEGGGDGFYYCLIEKCPD